MEINIRLDPEFTRGLERLTKNYGDRLAELNGFSDAQLSYTDFIDNFVDKTTVADASIDGNANVGHKDIVSLENEMSKPHSKLLSFNKIFYEMKKKYGLNDANDWLTKEWIGHYYMHDAYNSTYKPYCFSGETKILTKDGIKRLDELVGQQIQVLNKNHNWEDATVKNFGRQSLCSLRIHRVTDSDDILNREIFVTSNHKWFVTESSSGFTPDDISLLSTRELLPGMFIPFNQSASDDPQYNWVVDAVSVTDRAEDVYCAVVPGTESFTLDGNVLTHNCFAYDIEELAKRGLYFIEGFNAQPPQHLITFTDFVVEFVSWCSNRTSGAVGLPNFLVYSYYFWKKDVENCYLLSSPEYYRDQEFQRIIYKLNQPYVRGRRNTALQLLFC